MKKKISLSDKIFIAGSLGMVGSAIQRSFLKSGYGFDENGGKLLTPSRKTLDLSNFNLLKDWFSKNRPDVVVIAAAKVGGIYANATFPLDFILDNLKIQTNLIELSYEFKVKRLLFLGSSCIYPKYAKQPIREEYLLSGELEKTNEWYAIAKIAGIKLCEAFKIQKGFDAISLMPTNLYGPGDNYNYKNSHVIAAFIRKFYEAKINNQPTITCWGSGEPFREFLHVDDLAEAVKFVLENWEQSKDENHSFLNVGCGKDIKIKDLANKIASKFNYKGDIIWDTSKPDGTPKKQLSIERIRKLGWEPKIELDEGLDHTIKCFKKELQQNICRL